MSGELRLSSFEVEGFRAIRRLSLPVLGRVNLFVGENNAGKSSLLEALHLYFHRNSRVLSALLLQITREHSDLRPPAFSSQGDLFDSVDFQAVLDAIEGLFFGSFEDQPLGSIRLFPEAMPSTGLTIRLPWSEALDGRTGDHATRPAAIDPAAPLLDFRSEKVEGELSLQWFIRSIPVPRRERGVPSVSVPVTGLGMSRLYKMWDTVAISGDEPLVEEAVRTMVPRLERIVVTGQPGARSVLCKVHGAARPIPIKSMGDGTNRVFGLAVALVAARGGALLIDEVENGLHRSVHDDVWKLIYTLSERLDVQVFATTHSWEAVVGFQAAATASPAEGMLYRLEREPDGEIYVERYTEKEVAVATEHQIEVR